MFQLVCAVCGVKFTEKDALFEHLNSAHPDAKPVSFIRSNKGNLKLAYDGYMYYLLRSNKQKHTWQCDVRRCRGAAYTRGQTFDDSASILVKYLRHNHPGSAVKVARERALEKVYAEAVDSDEPPLSIHQRLLASVDKDVAAIMPSLQALSVAINRRRKAKAARKGEGRSEK